MACLLFAILFLPLLFGLATCNLVQGNEKRGVADLSLPTTAPLRSFTIFGPGGLAGSPHIVHPTKRDGEGLPLTTIPLLATLPVSTRRPSLPCHIIGTDCGDPRSTATLESTAVPESLTTFTVSAQPSSITGSIVVITDGEHSHTHTNHRTHPHHSAGNTEKWSTYTLARSPIEDSTDGETSILANLATDAFGPFQYLPTPLEADKVREVQVGDEVQTIHPWHSPIPMARDEVKTSFHADVTTSYPPLPTVSPNLNTPGCVSTYWQLQSPYQTGKTKTVWTSTATVLASVICTGCTNLVVTTKSMGFSSDHWFRHTTTISSVVTQVNIVGCVTSTHAPGAPWATATAAP